MQKLGHVLARLNLLVLAKDGVQKCSSFSFELIFVFVLAKSVFTLEISPYRPMLSFEIVRIY